MIDRATTRVFFIGLDPLRFIAATLVLVMHAYGFFIRNISDGISYHAIYGKGHTAVSFFFTLSGFLISYLLLNELQKKGSVNIRVFYLKRVFRIWPLYFLIVFFGLAFYNYFLPLATGNYEYKSDIGVGFLFYLFFLASYYNVFWNVGAILNVTWSIAVEEQFYLFWAPLFHRFKKRIGTVCFFTFALFWAIQLYNYHFITEAHWKYFIAMLQFNNMAVGGLFALYLHKNKDTPIKLASAWWLKRSTQFVVLLALFAYLFLLDFDHYNPYANLVLNLLYAYVILCCSLNMQSVFSLNNSFFNMGGSISYGIYMYHSIIIYFIGYLVTKTTIKNYLISYPELSWTLFLVLVFIVTMITSYLSFHYVEKRIVNLGQKLTIKFTKSVQYSTR
ncbi:MAG TPA: acyltransferase [Flavipsychrobacter sp.]|nr:acyltransferase [Flavipsychrobacter sp.]